MKSTSSKLKIFVLQRTPSRKCKKQATEREKFFGNHISDKELVTKMYQQLLNVKIYQHFSKDNIQMANQHMKRYSVSLGIRKMQIKSQRDTTSHPLGWL